MRRLYVTRERALACFALVYHCVTGQTREEHLRWAEEQDRAELMVSRGPGSLRNGETTALEIGEEATTLFVVAYQEHGALTSEELELSAGADDLHCIVSTRFDGDRRLCLELRRSEEAAD